jgi:magnesium transporter
MQKNEATQQSVRWVDIIDPTPEAVEALRREFALHESDVRDALAQGQRPKLVQQSGYVFMVLLFPIYNRKTRQIFPSEIDVFIGKDFFLTVHDGHLSTATELFQAFQHGNGADSSVSLATELLERSLNGIFPMLDHVSKDIRTVDQGIFNGQERKMVHEILIMRRNMTEFRKIMQSHKRTIQRLIDTLHDMGWFRDSLMRSRMDQLTETTKDIWITLENYAETIQALQSTNESLISFRLNDIMKHYTSMSVVIFVMTLVTAIFAAGAAGNPLLSRANGFYILLGVVALTGIGMVQYFRQKRWL